MALLSEHRCFGSVQGFFRRDSTSKLPMRFAVYLPRRDPRGSRPPAR